MSLRGRGAARVAVSLVLLAVLLLRTDRSELISIVGALDAKLFLAAIACYLTAQVVSTFRWQILLTSEGIPVPFGRLLLFYLEGMFFSLFLPTVIGGDVFRAHRVYNHTQRNEAAVASILVERLSGLGALLAVAWGSLVSNRDPAIAVPVLGFSAAVLVGVAAAFSRTVKAIGRRALGRPAFAHMETGITAFYHAIGRYRHRRGVLGQVFGLSLFVQVVVIYAHFLIGRALGISTPFVVFLSLIPLATVVAMLPVSVGGLGVRDGAMVYLFGRTGLPVADALGLSLGWFFVTVVCSLAGGVAFAFGDRGRAPLGAHASES